MGTGEWCEGVPGNIGTGELCEGETGTGMLFWEELSLGSSCSGAGLCPETAMPEDAIRLILGTGGREVFISDAVCTAKYLTIAF